MKFLPPLVLCCASLICVLSFDASAQSKQQNPTQAVVPRVGTIKDYPATGLMTGCGNLYFYPASQRTTTSAAYVFIAHGDGSNAWMNLGGRDVRLKQIKSLRRENEKLGGYNYRLGTLRINVVIEPFKLENATVAEGDSMFRMKITLRQGSSVRIVRAVGDSDC